MTKLFNIIIATAFAVSSTAANAATPVTIEVERMAVIRDAAVTICQQAVDERGDAADLVLRKARPLHLNMVEEFYLINLCILYVQGRQDQSVGDMTT